MTLLRKKIGLLSALSLLLIAGFLSTSLGAYFVSVKAMRDHIISTELPLTGDTIYSEIQRDLLHPIFISSLMANDTLLKDWMLAGERDPKQVSTYLKAIKEKYRTYSSFLISEKTHRYYYGDGILKTIDATEPRDAWYYRVRAMDSEYEINVDIDMANSDKLTVFVNHKIFDAEDNYLGATGVGLTIDSVGRMMERYSQKYGHGICFVTPTGEIILRSSTISAEPENIRDVEGLNAVADAILSHDGTTFRVTRSSGYVHLNTRYIQELDWHLVIEQAETPLIESTFEALLVNLSLCAIITAIVLGLTYMSIEAYQQRIALMFSAERELRQESLAQQFEISTQNEALAKKNIALEAAFSKVKTLSGLLPICASCKRIRSEEGYWKQVEVYVTEHSHAEFSHGICPNCMDQLYPIVKGKSDPKT